MLLGDHFPEHSTAQMTLQGSLQHSEPEFCRASGKECKRCQREQTKKEDTGWTGLQA